jgi:hypothetical protein
MSIQEAEHHRQLAYHHIELGKLHQARADYLDPPGPTGTEGEPSGPESSFRGLKTATIDKLMENPDSPNTHIALRRLEEMGLVELVPGRVPQHWRLTAQGLASDVNVLSDNATRQRAVFMVLKAWHEKGGPAD